MVNHSVRYPTIKTMSSFAASAAFTLATSFAMLFSLSSPSQAAYRKLYEHDYLLQHPDALGLKIVPFKATPSHALQELRRCFNCSFPVGGAPRAYPTLGQFIPLVVCATGGFGCQKAPVKAYPTDGLYQLRLVAEPGHFDGTGSSVTFNFYTSKGGYLHLKVTGYVTSPIIPDILNKAASRLVWSDFAWNLGNNMWSNTCKQGKVCGAS